LSWAELACRDGTPYPTVWRADRAAALAAVFEALRAAAGHRPLRVLSAYRTPAYNARVPGAAPNSQHVKGRALDVAWPPHLAPATFQQIAIALAAARTTPLRGLGIYPWGLHVDVRPTDRVVRWSGGKRVQVAPEVDAHG